MPAYHYTAIQVDGQEQKGVIEAETEKHARQLLRDKSLLPLQVRPAAAKKLINGEKTKFAFFNRQRGLTSQEIALITRLLPLWRRIKL